MIRHDALSFSAWVIASRKYALEAGVIGPLNSPM
jgi:hypothetical protein